MTPVDTVLVESIRRARAEGRTLEAIYLDLLQRGLTVAAIQAHVEAAAVGGAEPVPGTGAARRPAIRVAPERRGSAHGGRGPDAEAREATGTRAARLLLLAAAAFVAAGVFSFVAANWEAMPRPLRLTLVLAVMLAASVAGWMLQDRRGHERLGESLLGLGTLVYGAGIFLVGQMFNVRANWPDGFVLWCLGAVAMAHAVRVRVLFAVAIVTGAVALVGAPWSRVTAMRSERFALTEPTLMLAAALVTAVTGIVLVTRGRRARDPG
jgi:hypothetical protein